MIRWFLLMHHARKSKHPLKKYLSLKDFAFWLAEHDGYMEKLYGKRNFSQ